ncbi:Agenet-like domain [Arabidopsis suecica]|uniref:Agenet-like domain n=1 Tax=Arabidopsis suecica TaxID=45249 RepID=A0A8T2CBM7_ARASU|nr:Agenet-like domain [Arabidopsis suecica]
MAIFKDCEVEIFSEEDGFRNAWYRAILEVTPTNPTSESKKLRFSSMTKSLNKEGSSSPPTVEQRFIRPVPPENLYNGVVFEEGTMVDADYKHRWRTGVVINKMEDDSYLVLFDCPPDIIQFETKHLRAHLDWTGSEWVQPEVRELSKSMFSPGTLVEVSCVIDKVEVSWVTAMIVKEIEESGEKKFIVKVCNKHLSCRVDEAKPNMTVDSCCVRPRPPLFFVEEYDLRDCVEVLHGSSWRQGVVKGVHIEKQYTVTLEATKDKLVVKHSDLRPFKVWEDGVWHNGPQQKPVKESPSNAIKQKPMCSSSAETVAATGKLEKMGIGALMNDTTPPVITIAEESVSCVTPLKQTEANAEGNKLEPMRNQNCLRNDSTQQMLPEEENSKDGSTKRKREEKHNSASSVMDETDGTCNGSESEISNTGKSICNNDDVDDQPLSTELPYYQSLSVVNSFAADAEETPAKSARTISPFAKNPLFKAKEDIREWSAVGMMVTFYCLLKEVKDLQLDDSSSKLSSLSSSLAELEKHGFNVTDPLSRISKVLPLQDKRAKKAEERKCLEKKIECEEIERKRFEEEFADFERIIIEKKRQALVAKEKKEAADKRIGEMKTCAETIDQEIKDEELEFQTTVSTPW